MENNTLDTTLLFVTSETDYGKVTRIGFNHFKDKKRVDFNYNAIVATIESLDEEAPFVLFFHLNAENLKKFAPALRGIVEDIKKKYPDLEIYYNTSLKTDVNLKEVNEVIPGFDEHYLFGNNDIAKNIEKGTIKKQTKKRFTSSITANKVVSEQGDVSVFLSHSREDDDIMRDFKDMLLEAGLQIPYKNIFYSSERSSGVPTSENIPTALYEGIKHKTLFIRYVSKNYNKSMVCHNEYGAAWYKNQNDLKKIITLKEKGLLSSEIGFLNAQSNYLNIEDETALRQFREDYKEYFPNTNDNKWEEILKKFITKHFS